MTKSICKRLSFVLSIVLCMACFTLTAFASSPSETTDSYEKEIFEHFVDDYLLITGVDEKEATEIFNTVVNNRSLPQKDIESLVYGAEKNERYEDTVLYIQENYDKIVSGLNSEDKELLDRYYLSAAIQYYKDYGSADDFSDASSTTEKGISPIEPLFIDNEDFENSFVDEKEIVLEEKQSEQSRAAKVATVRVFADPTKSTVGSSGLEINLGTHAWITVSNISDNNITVGKFSVAPGKTMALGTWGNQSEHIGLWYNLESYKIKNNSAYGNRVSLRVDITSSSLSTLNSHMIGRDKWTRTNNCSSFAVTSWNKICSTTLSAGVINTPLNLANSIKGVSGYATGASVPHHYKVYYANGSNSPVLSTVYN